ncbi:DUF2231 domain-containing protein [Micromonospora musae]|uniref:DUF2231 domain-containing protein n=1 Tax=Micromonospora musae TaxID=1894970 RepID=UPI0034167819
MFEEFMGIPAHPLVLHAAVVFVPLLALLSVGYAFVPVIRPHTRWVLGLLAVGAPASALLTKLSGDAFLARLRGANQVSPEYLPRLEAHQDLGNLTLYATIAAAVVALALVRLVAPAGSPAAAANRPALTWSLRALSLLTAAAALYYVIRTGDSGAKAVWEGL